jgi:hypothetical protein
MVIVGMEKFCPVQCESESRLAEARQDTLSCSPDKLFPFRHQPCILCIQEVTNLKTRVRTPATAFFKAVYPNKWYIVKSSKS